MSGAASLGRPVRIQLSQLPSGTLAPFRGQHHAAFIYFRRLVLCVGHMLSLSGERFRQRSSPAWQNVVCSTV